MEAVMDNWTDVFIVYKHPYGRQHGLNMQNTTGILSGYRGWKKSCTTTVHGLKLLHGTVRPIDGPPVPPTSMLRGFPVCAGTVRGLYGDCTGTVNSSRFVHVRSSGASPAVVCQKLQRGFSGQFDGRVYKPPYGRPYDLNGKDTTGFPSR